MAKYGAVKSATRIRLIAVYALIDKKRDDYKYKYEFLGKFRDFVDKNRIFFSRLFRW